MVAIDYEKFLDVITDSAQILDTDNIMLDARYDTTDVFKSKDYYGAYDQSVVDKYLALWEEWSELWAEECQLGYMGAIDWWWHPAALHINDDGDKGNTTRDMFNAYWEDPQNHQR